MRKQHEAQAVTILGGGAWGTAVAHLLASCGHNVLLWCFESEIADEINQQHHNSYYFSGIELPKKIRATASLKEACVHSTIIFEAVPVLFLRKTLEQAKPFVTDQHVWVVLSKGIENKTGFVPSQIIDDVFNRLCRTAIFSGPSFARDLAAQEVTGIDLAVEKDDAGLAILINKLVSCNYCLINIVNDKIGVQLGGALKNVIALTMGIALGAQASDNTRAFILTRGLDELAQCASYFGAEQKTLYGLSGFGDLILTSLGSLSKNMSFGVKLGQGMQFGHMSREGVLPEGINTIRSLVEIMKEKNLHFPLIKVTHDIIFSGYSFADLIAVLSAAQQVL